MYKHHRKGFLLGSEYDQVLGYWEIGGAPTIVESTESSYLTAIHEQTHLDDTINTYFGFFLNHEALIHKLGDHNQIIKIIKKLKINKLLRKSWAILEGSAVASEYITLVAFPGNVNKYQFMKSLPFKYKKAFSPLKFVADRMIVEHEGNDPHEVRFFYFLTSTLKMAIIELSLDLDVIMNVSGDYDYDNLRNDITKTNFKRNLQKILNTLHLIDLNRVALNIKEVSSLEDQSGDNQTIREAREFTLAFKKEILESIGLKYKEKILTDEFRVTTLHKIRRGIEESHPYLPKIRTDKKFHGMKTITAIPREEKLGEMSDQEVDFDEFIEHIEAREDHDDLMCSLVIISNLKDSMFLLSITDFISAENESYICGISQQSISCKVDKKQILELEEVQDNSTIGWLLYSSKSFDIEDSEIDFWLSLKQPVYLHVPFFHTGYINSLVDYLGADTKCFVSPMPGPLSMTLLIIKRRNISFYILTSSINLQTAKAGGNLVFPGAESKVFNYIENQSEDLLKASCVLALHILPGPEELFR